MRRQMLYMYLKNLCKLLSHVRRVRLHECCTSAYYSFEETQNGNNYAWDKDAQHTTSVCTRANHDKRKGDETRHIYGSSTKREETIVPMHTTGVLVNNRTSQTGSRTLA